ncbi:MAG: HlyD family efflux transporter periplasmic adaptor subunit [Spirochaetaceae bacterium]|jgi:multidrug efflux pump subunit AcrA (membrane-fusion protein)|nr:HlyD family efflux transporter periplasmic adaptor subunit [Spirochaetaceae bacterium]
MGREKSGLEAAAQVATVALCVSALTAACVRFREDSGYETSYRVRGETYENVIEIAGAVSAAKEQNLQAAGNGTVISVHVNKGDEVKAGQLILQMDDSEQRYNLARHEYEIDQKSLNGSPRELEIMAAQREVLLQRMRDRQITANFDGVIADLTAAAGDVLEAKDVAGVIIDRSYLKADVEVAETDAPKLKAGQKVSLYFPACGDQTIEGRVHSFPAIAAKSSRGASVVKAEIRVDSPPDIILPNYSFTGRIEISPPVKLLLVESEAIGYADTGKEGGRGQAFAEIIEGGASSGASKRRVNVSAEPYGNGFVRILDGLSEGDELAAQRVRPPSGGNRRQADAGGNAAGGQRNYPAMPMIPGMGGGQRVRR